MIIIEGSNCVGKTTVSRLLASKLGYHYVHFPTEKGVIYGLDIDTKYGDLFRKTDDQKYAKLDIDTNMIAIEAAGNVVVDRAWLSHTVYSGGIPPTNYSWNTVILYGSSDLLMSRFYSRKKDCNYTNTNRIAILRQIINNNDRFIELSKSMNIPLLCIDGLTPGEIITMILA